MNPHTLVALRLFGIFIKLVVGTLLFVPMAIALVCGLSPDGTIDGVISGIKLHVETYHYVTTGVAFLATLLSEQDWIKPEVSRESH